MEAKKGRWEDWEKDYLFKHYDTSTAAELAAHLGRSKSSIIEQKRKLKLKKNKKGLKAEEVNAMMAKHREVTENTSVQNLEEAQQRRYWLNQLQESAAWKQCVVMFDDNELDVYRNKYVETMMTLETVTEIEKGSIHIMISSMIRLDRYQQLEKEYRDMSEGGDPEAAGKAISLHREIKDTVEMYMKSEDTLNASRKQRIKEEGDQRLNVLELIKELDSKDARDKLGREADALKHIQSLEDKRLKDGGFIR
jgi:hypothetical protein